MPIDRSSQGSALERQLERPRLPGTSCHWSLQAAQQEDLGTITLAPGPGISGLAADEQLDKGIARGRRIELAGGPDVGVQEVASEAEGGAKVVG